MRPVDSYLRTERLVLRRFTPDDLDDLVSLDADPEVMRYVNGGHPTPREELRDVVLPFWLRLHELGDAWGFWVAEDRGTGQFQGWFHLRPQPDDPPDEPELGYRLRRGVWGTSYGEWPEPIPGDEHGDVEYAITRTEWARKVGPAPGR